MQESVLTDVSQSAGEEASSDDSLVRDTVPGTLYHHQAAKINKISRLTMVYASGMRRTMLSHKKMHCSDNINAP